MEQSIESPEQEFDFQEFSSFYKQLSAMENENCFGEINENDIIGELLSNEDKSETDDECEPIDGADDPIEKPSRSEALKALFVLKRYFPPDYNILESIEKDFYLSCDKDLVQTTLSSYFHTNNGKNSD